MRIQTSVDSYPVLNGNTCFVVGASSGREGGGGGGKKPQTPFHFSVVLNHSCCQNSP